MAEKQALNATMFTFRKRERSGVLTSSTIAFIVLFALMFGAFAALNWQGVQDYMTWIVSIAENPNAAYDPSSPAHMPPASVMALFPAYLLFLFVYYVLLAAYEAACLKWMIHGEVSGPFGLSLGADTWRVYAGYWIWFLLLIGAYFGFGIVGVIFVGSMFAIGSTADPSVAGSLVAVLPVMILLALLLIAFFAVRFAPAAATSIARRRFSFFQAWTVTKGRFWELLGSYVLLWLMYVVAVIVLTVAIGLALGFSALSATASNPDSSQAIETALASPATLIPIAVIYLLIIIVAFIWILAMFGVNARAAALALEEGKIAPAASS
jgi:hypothetical protein